MSWTFDCEKCGSVWSGEKYGWAKCKCGHFTKVMCTLDFRFRFKKSLFVPYIVTIVTLKTEHKQQLIVKSRNNIIFENY